MKSVMIANHRAGPIVIPRSVPGKEGVIHRISLTSLIFPPGTVTRVDTEIWEKVKASNAMVREYLDVGLLTENTRKTKIIATIETTSELIPPEHLQTHDEIEDGHRIEREIPGEITI